MNTKRYSPNELGEAASIIRKGGVVAFPTETVYGLGADATNTEAVTKVYLAKGRPSDNPLIVHISSIDMLEEHVGVISDKAQKLIDAYWPGPLTLIFNVLQTSNLSRKVTAGLKTVAFRMPDHDITLSFIKESGVPLVGPSANTSGKPSPTQANHVYDDLYSKIDGIIEGGECKVGIESTVLDLSNEDCPTILRPGLITQEDIESIIGKTQLDAHLHHEKEAPKSPGMKYQHYSPDTPVVIVSGDNEVWASAIEFYQSQGKTVGILTSKNKIEALSSDSVTHAYCLSQNSDINESMKHLFSGLRNLDTQLKKYSQSIMLVEGYEEDSRTLGYMNRLKKAANQNFFKA